ncbi:MAG: 23S rRNA (guanosine(2251)-2'-O)-methyltransferase RlmB [bacterium]|nr:23S rRNA (guanosine(2251)-2'-O)-methyltransferase RlmB [bacterium]
MRKKGTGRDRNSHADLSAEIKVGNEDDLFNLLEKSSAAPLILVLDQVQDPHNLGACLRTADGAGVDAVVIPRDRSVTLTETVRRVAAGAAESVKLFQVTNLARMLEGLKSAGLWIVGTTDRAETDIYSAKLVGPIALVLGAEGKGLRRLTAEKCDFLMKIPMRGSVDCLNVSVSAGICLYEAVRQRSGDHS